MIKKFKNKRDKVRLKDLPVPTENDIINWENNYVNKTQIKKSKKTNQFIRN